MTRIALTAVVLALSIASLAPAATILFCPFDSMQGWSVRAAGVVEAGIVEKSDNDRCAALRSRQGAVFLTRDLPLDDVRGCRLSVSCLVKAEGVVRGPQVSSTGKIHLAVQTPRGVSHYSARLAGTSDRWKMEGFSLHVPHDVQRVVLNLALEACQGRVLFDRLLVKNDRRGVHQLDLSQVANADHGQLGIGAFPRETVVWEGIPFTILDGRRNEDRDCLRLRGLGHEDWPASLTSRIPVNSCASKIYILQAALGGRPSSDTPCAMWSAWFAGGYSSGPSIFEGQEIGPLGGTDDLPKWRVAWHGKDDQGNDVTFGVTEWSVHMDAPILSLSCQAYQGASPVVLAITVLEEAPAKLEESENPDDWSPPSE